MRKFILAIIAVMVFASLAYAAVSSPCSGRRPPAKQPAPREIAEEQYKRDPQGFRIPLQTVDEGTWHRAKATQDEQNTEK